MAKSKIAIVIKQDMLAECDKKMRDRLLKKPIGLVEKKYLYEFKGKAEVEDPDWDAKAFRETLFYSIRRKMQLLSVRAGQELKKFDAIGHPIKQIKQIGILKKVLEDTAKDIRKNADYNMKLIIKEATQDTATWDKGRDAKDFMEEIEDAKDAFTKSLKTMDEEFLDASSDIRKFENQRLAMKEDDKKDPEGTKLDANRKVKREAIKERAKDMGGTFSTYRQDRRDFQKLLKESGKKMNRMIDSKLANDDKELKKLKDAFKKIGSAADDYGKYLDKQDGEMMKALKPLLKFGADTDSAYIAIGGINKLRALVPDAKGGKAQKLFKLIDNAKKDLKKIKAAKK